MRYALTTSRISGLTGDRLGAGTAMAVNRLGPGSRTTRPIVVYNPMCGPVESGALVRVEKIGGYLIIVAAPG